MQHSLTFVLLATLTAPVIAQTDRVLPAGYERVWAGNNGTGVGYATQNGISQNQPAFALLGFDLTPLLGAVPLPFDLTPWGVTGCTLLVDMTASIPAATNASGAASVSLPIPGAGVTGLGFGMQWVYVDPAAPNPLQLLTTAGRLVHIGPLICGNRYVYSLSNVNATTGTVQAGGPIARVRTVP